MQYSNIILICTISLWGLSFRMKKYLKIISVLILFIIAIYVVISNKTDNKQISNTPVKIAFITDNNYILPVRTAINSIAANKNKQTKIEIYVIGVDLTYTSNQKLAKASRKNVQVNIVNISGDELKGLPGGARDNPTVSRADNAKFFMASILDNIDKIIYLDGDVIILKDLSEMFNTDIESYYAAVVDDWQSGWADKTQKRYFNNGIMLLNLKKMREDNLENKLIKFKINDTVKRFVTQDAFNTVMYNNVLYLPLIYDTFAPEYDSQIILERVKQVLNQNYDPNIYNYKDEQDYRNDVAIIHYCGYGNIKPWKQLDFSRKSSQQWYKYAPIDFWINHFSKNI